MVILIAEDELSIRRALELLLKSEHDVILCADGMSALKELESTTVDLVITDFQMPNLSGLELIRRGKQISPSTSFVLMTAFGSIHQAVEAVRLGAEDYFTKPFDVTEIEHRIRKIEELRSYKLEKSLKVKPEHLAKRLVGASRTAKEMVRFVSSAATSTAPVLIEGPIGCGKEFLARLIHDSSSRAIYPFITVDCTGHEPGEIEAEVFGVEKGSLPEDQLRAGKIEFARGGTIFLDGVGELSEGTQAKFLKLIDEKTFCRVGGSREIRGNARIIASSRTPLKSLVAQKTFREDLFYHLNILTIAIPALSARPEDIPLLIRFFWGKLRKEMRITAQLADDTIDHLTNHLYPGNIRELENVLERLAVTSAGSALINVDRLPDEFRRDSPRNAVVDEKIVNLVLDRLKDPGNSLRERLLEHGISLTEKKAA